jgi:hypothetical protein
MQPIATSRAAWAGLIARAICTRAAYPAAPGVLASAQESIQTQYSTDLDMIDSFNHFDNGEKPDHERQLKQCSESYAGLWWWLWLLIDPAESCQILLYTLVWD